MFLERSLLTKRQHLLNNLRCPCGRIAMGQPLFFDKCCGQYIDHFDIRPAPDPVSLMRSRYTAFFFERERYLLDTWHPTERPRSVEFDPKTQWLGLDVQSQKMLDLDTAEVEFVARFRLNGRATRLHENSLFKRNNGRWFYVVAQTD